MTYANPHWLVETDWLAANLERPTLRVFDCTTYLRPDPATVYRVESGRADYDAGHIPGAGFLDLQGELSDPDSDLRFTFPTPARFAEAVGRHGVGDDCRVVLYSGDSMMWSTRVWWMFRAMGFDHVAVLNGGWQRWQAEGRPVSTEACRYPPATFTPRPRPELYASKGSVLAALDGSACVLNALSAEQHAGTGGRNYGRPGRVAGSVNVPARSLTDPESNRFLPAEALAARFRAAGVLEAEKVIAYCGGGIAATADAFALALIGREDVAVYDNSLSEWARDPSLPMETG